MKLTHWIIVILLFILAIQKACHNRETKELRSEIGILSVEKQTNDSLISKQGDIIKTQAVILVEDKKKLKEYTDSIFNLQKRHERKVKEVIAYYKNISRVDVDSVFVFETDTIAIPEYVTVEFINDSMITVPRTYILDEPYLKLNATVRKDGLMLNNITLPDTLHGRFIDKKQGFLKPRIKEYQYYNTNPYIKQEGSNSIIVEEKGKTWDKIKKGALILGLGFLLGTQI